MLRNYGAKGMGGTPLLGSAENHTQQLQELSLYGVDDEPAELPPHPRAA